ncbi:glycosyltransferase [Streptomyces massasporeus]|uniref:glycosyltransferase n=1 Tax=Streptomyces massasporeus TaxID=67324 RepID=UPI0037F8D47C
MTDFLFCTKPISGHITPALPVVSELVRRGHRVRWIVEDDFAEMVERAGARHVTPAHTPSLANLIEAGSDPLDAQFVDLIPGQLADYRACLEEFPASAVITDSTSGLGAMILHELGGPPWATLGVSPLALPSPETPPWRSGLPPATTAEDRERYRQMHWEHAHVQTPGVTRGFNALRTGLGLAPLEPAVSIWDILCSSFLHLQCGTRSLDYPRPGLSPAIRYVGATVATEPGATADLPPWWSELRGDRPVVFVSQGTLATDPGDLVLPTIDALAGQDVLLVVSTPDPRGLGPLPENVRAAAYVPYQDVLPLAQVMVTNGGFNGVQIALSHGVPLVVAGDTDDKPEVANRVRLAGVGIDLHTGRPKPDQLSRAVAKVLADRSYRDQAARVRADFAGHGGAAEAADLLVELASGAVPRQAV